MYTLIIAAGLFGSFLLYHTSVKMKLARDGGLAGWSAVNRPVSKALGAILLLASILALVLKDGLGSGLFTGLLLLMVASSSIIVLAPLRLLKTSYVLIAFGLCLILELLIFH